MINIKNIKLQFNEKIIFNEISLFISEGNRIGIVGENGTGKTTLLKAILGEVYLDAGSVEMPNKKTIGMLKQEAVEFDKKIGIIDYLKDESGITSLEDEVKLCENEISKIEDHESIEYQNLLKRYDGAVDRFNHKDGYSFDSKVKQILKGLGFEDTDLNNNKKCTEFSGGWKIRISLALILLINPDIMLLDEPTNHLDTESMEWLENYLKDYRGTILTISHDKRFLDKIVKTIIELHTGNLAIYKGNFSFYLVEKDRRIAALKKEMEEQRSEIKKIEEFIERFRYKSTKAKQVQSRIKMLEKYKIITINETNKKVRVKFPEHEKSGTEVLTINNITHSYEKPPKVKNIIEDLNFEVSREERVAFVGKNGAGKSTLSKIIAEKLKPSSGSVKFGYKVKSAFFSQESSENLDADGKDNTILEEISEVGSKLSELEKRNILGAFLFSGNDIYKKITVLSGGEKSRLSLLKILLQGSNLLILDEPTNHLDIKTKEIFQNALIDYIGTIIIVSHDRYFLDDLVTKVIEISSKKVKEYLGNYSYFIEKREKDKNDNYELGITNYEIKQNYQNVNLSNDENDNIKKVANAEYKSKEQKRLEAEKRKEIHQKTKKLKIQLDELEKGVSAKEDRKEEVEYLLCTEEVLKDSAQIIILNKELNTISDELDNDYNIWEEVSEKIASIEG